MSCSFTSRFSAAPGTLGVLAIDFESGQAVRGFRNNMFGVANCPLSVVVQLYKCKKGISKRLAVQQ